MCVSRLAGRVWQNTQFWIRSEATKLNFLKLASNNMETSATILIKKVNIK